MTPKQRFDRLRVLGGLVLIMRWSIRAMASRGGNHGDSRSVGREGRVVGNNDGGERSKRQNHHFGFQNLLPTGSPPPSPEI